MSTHTILLVNLSRFPAQHSRDSQLVPKSGLIPRFALRGTRGQAGSPVLAEVRPEVWDRERDRAPLAGVDQALLDQ
jgi:hypothetical protein